MHISLSSRSGCSSSTSRPARQVMMGCMRATFTMFIALLNPLVGDGGLPGGDLFPDAEMGLPEDDDDMQVDTGLLATITRSCGTAQNHAKQVTKLDREICGLILKLGGGSKRQYLRERKDALQRVISEVYSPPRVTAAIKMLPSLRVIGDADV